MPDDFYASLPVLNEFADAADVANYADVPDGWVIVLSDVAGSTRAIRDGRYKQVNLAGAATIAAVLNAVKPLPVPYVFGGDGATLVVPANREPVVRAALAATARMAADEFDLDLRVGVVPVGDVRAAGRQLRVAKVRISEHYYQAVFGGGGLAHAESLLKDADHAHYRVDVAPTRPADYSGLECRWEDIPSPHEETITLLVAARRDEAAVYRDVLRQLDAIYGDADRCRPVQLNALELTRLRDKLTNEVQLRTHARGRLARAIYWRWLGFQMFVGRIVFRRMMKFGGVDWGQYKRDLVANTDYRKFDDMLRQVISGTVEQRGQLTAYLEDRRAAGDLRYGIHAAPSALMTCLIFKRVGEHVHFVDGSAGGYAMAAKQLKAQADG